jgi:hypothetical protein
MLFFPTPEERKTWTTGKEVVKSVSLNKENTSRHDNQKTARNA